MEGHGILADRLAGLADGRNLVLVSEMGCQVSEMGDAGGTEGPVTPSDTGEDATISPLTSANDEQSQRGSNPCLHLERGSGGDPVTRGDPENPS